MALIGQITDRAPWRITLFYNNTMNIKESIFNNSTKRSVAGSHKRKHFSTKCRPINEEGMIVIGNHFTTSTEIIDSD